MIRVDQILPPPVTLPDEEPSAAGWRRVRTRQACRKRRGIKSFLPPPATMLDEEPSAAGER